MSRTGFSRRRTPSELIWGWGTNGERHPGLLERMEGVEKMLSRQGRLLWIILLAIAANSAGNPGLVKALEQAAQIVGSLPSALIGLLLP